METIRQDSIHLAKIQLCSCENEQAEVNWKFHNKMKREPVSGETKPTILSKRDIGRTADENEPCCSKETDHRLLASRSEVHDYEEQSQGSYERNDTDESIQEIVSFPPEQPITAERGKEH